MNDEIKERLTDGGNDVALSIADSLISTFTIIPPIQTIKSIMTAYRGLKEGIFMEKLLEFLKQTEKVSEEAKGEFLELLGKDQSEFFKRIVIAIDRLDEKEKAEMLGKLFVSLINKKISIDDFRKLTYVIDNSFTTDLIYFAKAYSRKGYARQPNRPEYHEGHSFEEHFSSMGLLLQSLEMKDSHRYTLGLSNERKEPKIEFKVSRLGQLFADITY